VRGHAPWQTLDELLDTLRQKTETIVIAASGSIGSQDWMKLALVLDSAGINPNAIRCMIPTISAKGYNVVWPVWRGFYLPPQISNVLH